MKQTEFPIIERDLSVTETKHYEGRVWERTDSLTESKPCWGYPNTIGRFNVERFTMEEIVYLIEGRYMVSVFLYVNILITKEQLDKIRKSHQIWFFSYGTRKVLEKYQTDQLSR